MGFNPTAIDGDKKRYGVVYAATHGHGIMVGIPKENGENTEIISAEKDAAYKISFDYRAEEGEDIVLSVDDTKNNCEVTKDKKWHTYTVTKDIPMGGHNIKIDSTDSFGTAFSVTNLKVQKIPIISVQRNGTYAVKIDYTFNDSTNKSMLTFKCGDKEYTLKYPKCGGEEASYVFDIELDEGRNEITAVTDGAEILSAEIFTESTRRYEGEEVSNQPDNMNLSYQDVWKGDPLKAQYGRIGTLSNTDMKPIGYTKSLGDVINYNADIAGTYLFSIRYNAEWWTAPVLYFNGEQKESPELLDFHNGSQTLLYNITVDLKAGENQIFIGTTGDNLQTSIAARNRYPTAFLSKSSYNALV